MDYWYRGAPRMPEPTHVSRAQVLNRNLDALRPAIATGALSRPQAANQLGVTVSTVSRALLPAPPNHATPMRRHCLRVICLRADARTRHLLYLSRRERDLDLNLLRLRAGTVVNAQDRRDVARRILRRSRSTANRVCLPI